MGEESAERGMRNWERMAFLLTQKIYHAMTLNNNDVAQKLKGIICNKLPSVIGYLKEVHRVGQAEEKAVPAESVRYREKVFMKLK